MAARRSVSLRPRPPRPRRGFGDNRSPAHGTQQRPRPSSRRPARRVGRAPAERRRPPPAGPGRTSARREVSVRRLAGPHESQSASTSSAACACFGDEVGEEECGPPREEVSYPRGEVALGFPRRRREEAVPVRKEERDAAVVRPDGGNSAPDDFPRGAEEVEVRRLVSGEPRGKDLGFQDRRRDCRALELLDDREKRVQARARPGDVLPLEKEPREGGRLDRLDFAAELRERASLERLQDLGVAPLARAAAGKEVAFDDPLRLREPLEGRTDRGDRETEARREVFRPEGAVRARPAGDEVAERVGDGLEERLGKARGRGNAERVAQPGGVFGGGEAISPSTSTRRSAAR